MIRHSSSFLISLFFHIVLAVLLFYTWKNVPIFHKKEIEKKITIPLCCLIQKETKKIIIPPKQIQRKEIKEVPLKKIKLPKKKQITKPIIKKKKPVKKEIPKQIKPVQKVQETKLVQTIIPKVIDNEKIKDQERKAREKKLKQEYIHAYMQKIVKLLSQNLYYPRSARKRGITGEVIVKFILSTNAIVTLSKVVESKSDILSRAAIKTIEDLSGKFPKPNEELILEVPISYKLN